MWEEVFRLAMGNGIWAVLFCVVFFYQLKDNKKRESKYQQVIMNLTDALTESVELKDIIETTSLKAVDVVRAECVQTRETVSETVLKYALKEGAR